MFFLKKKKDTFNQYIKNVFGFYPKNIDIYKMACTCRTASDKRSLINHTNNERLEYLGDAVLSLIVAEFLFKKYPLQMEGVLTEMRSKIVNRDRLNKLAHKIGLTSLICFGGNNNSKSVSGDTLEALIAAIFLDLGFKKTKKVIIEKLLLTHLDIDAIFLEEHNYKSKIFSWGQKEHKKIEFKHTEINDGNSKKMHKVELYVDNELFGEGYGYTIKEGEKDASEKAWQKCAPLETL